MDPQLNNSGIPQSESKSSGPVIGIVVVILLLVAGALYVWKMRSAETGLPVLPPIVENDPVLQNMEAVNTSTEPVDIEADLNATDFDQLDTDLGAILIETQ